MTLRPPSSLLATLAPTALLLGLATACQQEGPPPIPPLSDEALSAVVPEPGVSREALARAIDETFEADGIGETRALLLLHEGEVVAERYADGFDAETRHIGWSMSKTVTAVIIGMMVADGRVRLDDPAPIAKWQRTGDARGDITLRHLLQMRSGLRHEEQAKPVYTSNEVVMTYLNGRDNMGAWAEAQPLETEPGTSFRYSTPTAMILSDIATDLVSPDGDAAARALAMSEFVDARVAVPLGMDSLFCETDAAGTILGGSGCWASARDWARFGEFMRLGGVAGGVQVVPRRWIDFMTQPSPASPDYGAQLWLNRDSETDRNYLFAEQGPDSAYALIGYEGQYVIVAPEQRLTLVRIGRTSNAERAALVSELADIVSLYADR